MKTNRYTISDWVIFKRKTGRGNVRDRKGERGFCCDQLVHRSINLPFSGFKRNGKRVCRWRICTEVWSSIQRPPCHTLFRFVASNRLGLERARVGYQDHLLQSRSCLNAYRITGRIDREHRPDREVQSTNANQGAFSAAHCSNRCGQYSADVIGLDSSTRSPFPHTLLAVTSPRRISCILLHFPEVSAYAVGSSLTLGGCRWVCCRWLSA